MSRVTIYKEIEAQVSNYDRNHTATIYIGFTFEVNAEDELHHNFIFEKTQVPLIEDTLQQLGVTTRTLKKIEGTQLYKNINAKADFALINGTSREILDLFPNSEITDDLNIEGYTAYKSDEGYILINDEKIILENEITVITERRESYLQVNVYDNNSDLQRMFTFNEMASLALPELYNFFF